MHSTIYKSTDLYLPAYNVGSCSSVTAVSLLLVSYSSCVEVSSDTFTSSVVVAVGSIDEEVSTSAVVTGVVIVSSAIVKTPYFLNRSTSCGTSLIT